MKAQVIDQQAQPANGTQPATAQEPVISPEQAAEVLQQEARRHLEAYNQGMIRLTEQTGYAVTPALLLPGGEVVTLASWLAAYGIKAIPQLKIVPKDG